MPDINTPNDLFNEWFLSSKENFIALCHNFIPEELMKDMDTASAELVSGSFVK